MKLSGLDQHAYLIKEICDERQVSSTCRKLLENFHQRLNFEVNKRKHYWYARTHQRGVTYLVDDRKAYLFLDINQEFLSMKFFTGKGKIKGLKKSTWLQSAETCGSERYRITNDGSLERAVGFALKAYLLAQDW